ncbi:hypothetical protein PR048_003860 [Dryococelus australis]|uniref:Uncharacterized protein n=1 Tax=Dryococelus australis TaxID=614101 RepID=A0ABQ9IPC6_9NEOP|nr:hypothetical protein PR048_003860 [Dryococelus australis]
MSPNLALLCYQFVLAARDICSKLKQAGYAADFINPFSGRPFIGTFQNPAGDVSKEFSCSAFRINKQANCRVITEHKGNREFLGESVAFIKKSKENTV